MVERACVVCGSSFETSHNVKKTCSVFCSKEWVRVKARAYRKISIKKEKSCTVCGSPFTPRKSNNEKICSDSCRRKNKAGKAKKHRSLNPHYWKKYYEENKEMVDAQKSQYRKENPRPKVRSMLKNQLGVEPPEYLIEDATALRLLKRAINNA